MDTTPKTTHIIEFIIGGEFISLPIFVPSLIPGFLKSILSGGGEVIRVIAAA